MYPQGRRVLAEVAEQAVLTHGQFIHVEVVLMGMGHNQIGDRPEVQAEFERESVNIGWEIDQGGVVDHHAGAAADVFTAEFPSLLTSFAVTEDARESLRSGRAEILQFQPDQTPFLALSPL